MDMVQVLARLGVDRRERGVQDSFVDGRVQLGALDNGLPCWWTRTRMRADGIVVINRVKGMTYSAGRMRAGW